MTARFLIGDVFDQLTTLEDDTVDLVITSPPFLALRSYLPADHSDKDKEIGSEATPAAWLDVMLRFTAELRRVLAPHGSICIELGDTYAGGVGFNGTDQFSIDKGRGKMVMSGTGPLRERSSGWPLAKSKTLIPELYRIALAYGHNPLTGQPSPAGQWRIRNVVTWARPNPPVGALGDKWRPATSDVVVACTSPKRYWDDLATRKPVSNTTHARSATPRYDLPSQTRDGNWSSLAQVDSDPASGAPLLDYWEIPPGGYEGSHYAVFPPELVVPLVKAMCPEKVCRECGEPSRRIVNTEYEAHSPDTIEAQNGENKARAEYALQQRAENAQGMTHGRASRIDTTTGWTDCGHDNWRPGVVCDPFAGSGTTLLVATGHGHDAIGIDLDARNAQLALQRVGPFLLEVTT